jgi:copper/silver efflux system protein
MLKRIIKYFLDNSLISFILLTVVLFWGISTAPFHWSTGFLPRDPVPVDAIPDIGDNQQIIATEWMGRSPQNIQDQVTYPLTTALLGISGVSSIRSTSMFGMSFIYVIFNDKVDYYFSRSRILEKLASLPPGTLPPGIQPTLGPDATALGQIFWYTLEGRDPKTGKPTGGWDPQELRSIQDFYVKYGLASSDGVSEVASIGGFVKEYQVDINPDAMKSYGVTIMQIMSAVQNSNLDIGAQTIEMNKVEYMIRGLGYIKSISDLENAVVSVSNNVPVKIKDVARVSFGPGDRRGGLDKGGFEAVGGVVVARYGSNPMAVIANVKKKIDEISAGMPSKTLANGTVSKVTVIPFYDRSGLIRETIGTLEDALSHEILISIIVIIVLLINLRASLLVSGMLPLAVLMTFIIMRYTGVEANIVALSGIAIAIGVMVDVGIIMIENIMRHLEMPENAGVKGDALKNVIYLAAIEVSGAIVTALSTTVVSFLPVFAMQAAEGKLFRPLAFTKTFALLSSMVLGIVLVPLFSYLLYSIDFDKKSIRKKWNILLLLSGIILAIVFHSWIAMAISLFGINNLTENIWPVKRKKFPEWINIALAVLIAAYFLTIKWLPLGAQNGTFVNFLFVGFAIGIILGLLLFTIRHYEIMLRWCIAHKWKFLLIPILTLSFGITIWLGYERIFGFAADGIEKTGWKIRESAFWKAGTKTFPGIGKEFMPTLGEGSFLLMPTTMPHAGVEENIRIISSIDTRLNDIPEVEMAVGKWGRANSALDPAPTTMYENVINYLPEYILNDDGRRMRFKTDKGNNYLLRDGTTYNLKRDGYKKISEDQLIPDDKGNYFRQWRPEIRNPEDIWQEIIKASTYPGMTSAPRLQPIQTRLIMLSTGMRAPMGIKVFGPDIQSIEKTSVELEKILQEVPGIESSSVFAERNVASPYIEININRESIARYGLTIASIQEILQSAIGGMPLTTTVEGRERYPVRVRYPRELRSTVEDLGKILIPTMTGEQVPLNQLTEIVYHPGAQMIRSENTFLTNYVVFDKKPGVAEVNVIEAAQKLIDSKIASRQFQLPAGLTYKFAGNYEQQIRATRRLAIVIPISLIAIFLILYMRFKTITASFIHFSGVFVAFAGGFIMLWLYGQGWFMNFSISSINLRDLFQMHSVNLSVAVWVGFIALFGIATNDGVIMGTYIHQVFELKKPDTIETVREAVVVAGKQRVRPAMMTAAVAIIALLPVLTSTGKGSDIMVPMAIPTFGGMIIQIMTMFVVPVFQCMWREKAVKNNTERTIKQGEKNESQN